MKCERELDSSTNNIKEKSNYFIHFPALTTVPNLRSCFSQSGLCWHNYVVFEVTYSIIFVHRQKFMDRTPKITLWISLRLSEVVVVYLKLCMCNFFEDRLSSSRVILNLRKFSFIIFLKNLWMDLLKIWRNHR